MAGEVCTEQWFPKLSNGDVPSLRLCCFAFAGGSPSAFSTWAPALPHWVELRALQLPGRGARWREQPIGDMATLIPALCHAIAPLTDVPLVFFGHSNGALIAYELARALSRAAAAELRHIVLSSKPAPHSRQRTFDRHKLGDEELIEELARFGGTPAELLADRAFMRFMLPAIRADFALGETHHFNADDPLDVPAALWWATEDELVHEAEVKAWQRYLKRPAAVRGFSGGHFYIRQNKAEVLVRLLDVLQASRTA